MTAVDIPGLPALLDGLGQAAAGVVKLGDVDQAAGELVEVTGRPKAPRRTGRLASSVTVVAGVVKSTLPYAAPVHWGWERGRARVAGRPWLVQAADTATDDVAQLYMDHVDHQLAGV